VADPPDGPLDPFDDPFVASQADPPADLPADLPAEPSAAGPAPADTAPGAPAGPLPRSPEAEARRRRRLWRRRRRIVGSLVFVGVVVALGVIVANAVGGGDDDSKSADKSTSSSASTTTTLPLAGPYEVTDGINVRGGPGSTFPVLGQIEIGNTVLVACAIDGESVAGPGGATTKWLRIFVAGPPSYVTAAYVAVGADLTNPGVIATCPPV
jgi:hypothetical protein